MERTVLEKKEKKENKSASEGPSEDVSICCAPRAAPSMEQKAYKVVKRRLSNPRHSSRLESKKFIVEGVSQLEVNAVYMLIGV